MYQYTLGQYIMYQYIVYHTYIISWYTKYHPSCCTRILRTILGIRLGCHVLSHNMYQYMPETWTPWGTSKGNFSRGG